MALFGIFKRKNNRTVTDEQRESSLETRRMNKELKEEKARLEKLKLKEQHEIDMARLRLEKEELYDRLAEYDEEEDEEEDAPTNWEDLLMMQFAQKFINTNSAEQQNLNTSSSYTNGVGNGQANNQQQKVEISDDDIRQMISQFSKKQIKVAKSMPDSILLNQIISQTGFDKETAQRGIDILRNEY